MFIFFQEKSHWLRLLSFFLKFQTYSNVVTVSLFTCDSFLFLIHFDCFASYNVFSSLKRRHHMKMRHYNQTFYKNLFASVCHRKMLKQTFYVLWFSFDLSVENKKKNISSCYLNNTVNLLRCKCVNHSITLYAPTFTHSKMRRRRRRKIHSIETQNHTIMESHVWIWIRS